MVGGELSEKVRERQGVHIPVLFCRGLCHGRPMAAPTDPNAHSLTVDGGETRSRFAAGKPTATAPKGRNFTMA